MPAPTDVRVSTARGSMARTSQAPRRTTRPAVIGAIVVAAVAAAAAAVAAVWFAQDAASSTGAFGTELEVGYLAGDEAQLAVLEQVARTVAVDHGITVVPTPIGDPHGLARAVDDGRLAGAIHAHAPWIEEASDENGWQLTAAAPVYQRAQALYSSRHDSVEDLPDGAVVAFVDNPHDTAQALLLLAAADLITLDPDADPTAVTVEDIVANPRGLTLEPIAAGTAVERLDSVDAVVTYSSELIDASTPASYRIFAPDAPAAFAGQLMVATTHLDEPAIRDLIATFEDPGLQAYLATTIDHAVEGRLTELSDS